MVATTANKRGHRAHAETPRTRRKEVWFTAEELALIERASAMRGLRAGAYVASTATAAAKAQTRENAPTAPATSVELREVAAEVRELRRLLGNVAGNLNDVARHANSTGELGANADVVLAFTRRMNEKIDAALMGHLKALR